MTAIVSLWFVGPGGNVLATRTAAPHPLVSASPSSSAGLAPPAKFGRRAQAARGLHREGSAGRLSGYRDGFPGRRPIRALSVVLDDPAAVAQALGDQMEPADLMELMFILAEATAEVLRQRKQPQ